MPISNWLRRKPKPTKRPRSAWRRHRLPLHLEALEDRTLLAVSAISMADPAFYGDSGDGPSGGATGSLERAGSISADGNLVVFVSDATNLVTNENVSTEARDVYVRNLSAGTTTLVSVNQAGTMGGNDSSFDPKISAD